VTSNELLVRARELTREGRGLDALALLERAVEREPDNAAYLSELAALYALERGQVRRGLELSQEAVDKSPNNADIYFNLARIYLKGGYKIEALHVIDSGLAKNPDHPGLCELLITLGVRRRPLLRSLPRRHPLNHLLGWLATRLGLR
jgi:dihydrofolate reductase